MTGVQTCALPIFSVYYYSCVSINCIADATVLVSGGVAPYTYLWDDPASQTTATVTGLTPPGNVNVIVADNNGCQVFDGISVACFTPMSSSTDSTNVSCNSACDGSAFVSVSGGLPPYDYLWDDPMMQTDSLASGLCAGNYTVTVTDSNSCSTSDAVIMANATSLSLIVSTTDTDPGTCSGTVSVTATGGTNPLTYLWNDPGSQTTATATGLCADIFTVVVTDSTGCTATASDSVGIASGIPEKNAGFTFDVYPNPTNGTINLEFAMDKTEDLDISIMNKLGEIVNSVELNDALSGIHTIDLTNNSNGIYYIRIRANNATIVKRISILR